MPAPFLWALALGLGIAASGCSCDPAGLAPVPSAPDGGATSPKGDAGRPLSDAGVEDAGPDDAGLPGGADGGGEDSDGGIADAGPDPCLPVADFADALQWSIEIQHTAPSPISPARTLRADLRTVGPQDFGLLLVSNGRPRVGAELMSNAQAGTFTSVIRLKAAGAVQWARTHSGPGAQAGQDLHVDATGTFGLALHAVGRPVFDVEVPWVIDALSGGGTGGYSMSYHLAGERAEVPWVIFNEAAPLTMPAITANVPVADGRRLRALAFRDAASYEPVDGSLVGLLLETHTGLPADPSAERWDGLLAMHDASGALEWSVQVGGPSTDYVLGVEPLHDGSFLVIGRFLETAHFGPFSLSTDATEGSDFLLRITAEGEITWVHSARLHTGHRFRSIRPRGASGACMAGYFALGVETPVSPLEGELSLPGAEGPVLLTPEFSGLQAYVTCLDGDGNAVFARRIANEHAPYDDVTNTWRAYPGIGLDIAPDGTILVAGGIYGRALFDDGAGGQVEARAQGGPTDTDGFVARYSPEGVLLAVQQIATPAHTWLEAIAVHDDGSYAVVGNFQGCAVLGPGQENETWLMQAPTSFDAIPGFIAQFSPAQ